MAAALVIRAMACTAYARVKDESRKVTTNNGLDVAHATSYNFNTMSLQLIQSTRTHITCQHHLNTHLLQVGSNARLATAALRRREILTRENLFIFNGINRIVVAMTEVIIYATVTCWNSYFHILKF